MMWYYFSVIKFVLILLVLVIVLVFVLGWVENYFNLVFLFDDLFVVVDLLIFFCNVQVVGMYCVDVYLNNMFFVIRDIVFQVVKMMGKSVFIDDSGLCVCLMFEMFKNMGVNIGVFLLLVKVVVGSCLDFVSVILVVWICFDFV